MWGMHGMCDDAINTQCYGNSNSPCNNLNFINITKKLLPDCRMYLSSIKTKLILEHCLKKEKRNDSCQWLSISHSDITWMLRTEVIWKLKKKLHLEHGSKGESNYRSKKTDNDMALHEKDKQSNNRRIHDRTKKTKD